MSMMKALSSGVSGLQSQQTKMDVIGNNIANVTTTAYKTQTVNFADVYYDSTGVGYGSKVSSINTTYTLSGYTATDSATDLYINGEGYFKVQDSAGNDYYTRNGALSFDSSGNLVDSSGSQLYGWSGDIDPTDDNGDPELLTITDFENYEDITINTDGTITGIDNTSTSDTPVTIGCIAVALVPNQNGLILQGNSYYSAGTDAGTITYCAPGKDGSGTGSLITNALEDSGVDLATEFTDMIITQRGYQANSKVITTVDEMLEELLSIVR
jgi:flagellar hook protein FlgE